MYTFVNDIAGSCGVSLRKQPTSMNKAVIREGMAPMEHDMQLAGIVLVAHNDSDVRELAHQLLTTAGYLVVTSESGLAMIRAIREKHPDLIMLDSGGPLEHVIPKLELLHAAEQTDIPIVLMTSDTDDKQPNFDAYQRLDNAARGLKIYGV